MFNNKDVHFKNMVSQYIFSVWSVRISFQGHPRPLARHTVSPPPSLSFFVLHRVIDLKPGSPRGQKASAPDLCLRGRQGKLSPGTAIPSCAPLWASALIHELGMITAKCLPGLREDSTKYCRKRAFWKDTIIFWEERWLCRAPDQSWCSQVMRRHSTESQLCSDRKKQPWTWDAYVHLAGGRRPSWDTLLSSLKLHTNMYLLKHLESSYCSMCFTKLTHLIILAM